MMSKAQRILYVASWIPVTLLFTFPLLIFWPFVSMTMWTALTPIGLIFLGLVAVPFGIKYNWPRYLWLWGNDEEGCPEWWLKQAASGEEGKLAQRFPCWWWYAIRNPVNNHRFIFRDRADVKEETNFEGRLEAPDLLEAGQQMGYRWAWAGPFAGYRRVWLAGQDKYSEIWFGWKVGSEVPGLGFTFQVRLKRKIGT